MNSARCGAAHPDDRRPCDGGLVVRIVDRHGGAVTGCHLHAVTLVAHVAHVTVWPLLPGSLSAKMVIRDAARRCSSTGTS